MNAAGFITKPARALVLASGVIAAASIAGFAQDVLVGLGTLASLPIAAAYVNPPTGQASLGGHLFDLSSGNMIALAPGQSASISGSYPNATAAYFLINSYNTYTAGVPMGQIVQTFSDGTTQTTTLMTGSNIREWRPGWNTVNTAIDPNLVNVWNGQAQPAAGGGTAIIDMLTITAPSPYKTLTNIAIHNNNPFGIGMIVPGITINDGPAPHPICVRPGNSCHTPAAENSRAWKWQPQLPGATNTNPHARGDAARPGDDTDRDN